MYKKGGGGTVPTKLQIVNARTSINKIKYTYTYTYKVVISVCLYVRSELRKYLTDLSQILIVELVRRTTRMFLAKFNEFTFFKESLVFRESWDPKSQFNCFCHIFLSPLV